ncbi:NADH dehydrogenase [ubiquinone] 1 beta subcomplex subunit 3 [Battus philenor]|uniref:NADH dehydrogenase [ubiquinone] 1 beta subcomplex subunit 3 n=1 Tax=Battus philenor TaxID=42288 RepID=UPI0035CEF465
MGHGGPPYVIPDYKQFQVKGITQLEELQKALEKKGLKDPWIRNEAWRYHPGFGTPGARAMKFFFRGFPLGLALTIATVAITKMAGGDDEHGHGHH